MGMVLNYASKDNNSSPAESMPDDPYLGRRIRGYCLEELLGRGTLTAVYRGRTEELWLPPELIITLLLVPPTLSEQAQMSFRRRFMQEARRLALIRHAHLVPLYGYGEQEELLYLLTPPTEGEPLTHLLREKSRWSSSEALAILAPLAILFDYLHTQELVYQFFNPANVLIQNHETVLLSGPGLAQLLSIKGLEASQEAASSYQHLKSIAGTYLGVPEYLSPEIVRGGKVDGRSDIYALGILLFTMLSGAAPFTGCDYLEIAQKHVREPLPSLHALAPDLPIALELAVNRALHRNPERRFHSLDEFITAYAHVIDERINAPKHTRLVQSIEQLKLPLRSHSTAHLMLAAPRRETVESSPPAMPPLPMKSTDPVQEEEEQQIEVVSDPASVASQAGWEEEEEEGEGEEQIDELDPVPTTPQTSKVHGGGNDHFLVAEGADALFEELDEPLITTTFAPLTPDVLAQIPEETDPAVEVPRRPSSPVELQPPQKVQHRDTAASFALPAPSPRTASRQMEQSTASGESPTRGKIADMVNQIQQMKERLQSQSNTASVKALPAPRAAEDFLR